MSAIYDASNFQRKEVLFIGGSVFLRKLFTAKSFFLQIHL
jgi:hypothetical protein